MYAYPWLAWYLKKILKRSIAFFNEYLVIINSFLVFFLFYIVVRLFSHWSEKTSKCEVNIIRHFFVLTTFFFLILL